ncbi:hypothetical protein KY309_03620 [Candidatus Woesearchaeota archaeon]|nr:hypothetical protein [Candidatus Woesearchaeota archaeon]MBW3016671.1 hypothetical protein [Candidatus Woesearchaeota archaeon]
MNENTTMYAVLGAVLIVTVAGLYLTTGSSNKITGQQIFTDALYDNILLNAISVEATPGVAQINPAACTELSYTDAGCVGVGDVCTLGLYTPITATVLANVVTDVKTSVSDPSPFNGGGDNMQVGNVQALPPLAPNCLQSAYVDLDVAGPGDVVVAETVPAVAPTTLTIPMGARNVDLTGGVNPPGSYPTTLTITAYESLGVCTH